MGYGSQGTQGYVAVRVVEQVMDHGVDPFLGFALVGCGSRHGCVFRRQRYWFGGSVHEVPAHKKMEEAEEEQGGKKGEDDVAGGFAEGTGRNFAPGFTDGEDSGCQEDT